MGARIRPNGRRMVSGDEAGGGASSGAVGVRLEGTEDQGERGRRWGGSQRSRSCARVSSRKGDGGESAMMNGGDPRRETTNGSGVRAPLVVRTGVVEGVDDGASIWHGAAASRRRWPRGLTMAGHGSAREERRGEGRASEGE